VGLPEGNILLYQVLGQIGCSHKSLLRGMEQNFPVERKTGQKFNHNCQ
jgi:hypothetical protein